MHSETRKTWNALKKLTGEFIACPKMGPIACSPVPLKVLESLVLNEIGSITTRPNDPYQFVYRAKRSTLDAVACLTHAINSHLDKGCKGFKAVFLDFAMHLIHCHVKGYSTILLPQITHTGWLNGSTITSLVVVNIFGHTIRYLARSQTTAAFFKVQFFPLSFSPFIPPIFSLIH